MDPCANYFLELIPASPNPTEPKFMSIRTFLLAS
ncbi:MAG: hypothetical protein ACI841_004887, partial [Planctomycetota bacterium]